MATWRDGTRRSRPARRAARRARSDTSAVGRLLDLRVADAVKQVPGLDTRQLRTALRRERDGRGRKTLLRRLESELERR